MVRRALVVLALAVAAVPLAAACGTDAAGIDQCKAIEEARCQQAPNCPQITLEPPYHTSGNDVDACIRFYDVACLHGLASGNVPSTTQLNACVKAIQSSCDYVVAPENSPDCAFLIPPSTPEAGPAEAEAAATDAGDGASE
ncbi:MAG TPA: hypothetical protein VIF15_12620 [Polyangiaceae bacterium]|jgi:hypothetical protein